MKIIAVNDNNSGRKSRSQLDNGWFNNVFNEKAWQVKWRRPQRKGEISILGSTAQPETAAEKLQ